MKFGLRQTLGAAVVALLALFVCMAPAPAQTTPAKKPGPATPRKPAAARTAAAASNKPLMADQVYKNIQVLKGLTQDQFIDTMAFISGGLGTNCIHCHSNYISEGTHARWAAFAIDTPAKQTARQMIRMVQHDNATYFGGQQVITCFTCHLGSDDPPQDIPSIALQYGPPTVNPPDMIQAQNPNSPQPDALIDKYVAAVGGTDKVATVTSFTEKGTYSGYDTDFQAIPMEIDAKAPDKNAWIVQTAFGTRSRVINGTDGWNATPDTSQVLPILQITGGRRFMYKVMAELVFPAEIKSSMTRWRTGKEEMIAGEPGNEDIKERPAYPVQGIDSAGLPIKLYFDKATGLLDRVYSYSKTPLGIIAAETDYSDYRDIGNGVKMPFHWVESATDGQSVYNLTGVTPNTPLPDSRFAEPPVPKLLTPPPEAGADEKNQKP